MLLHQIHSPSTSELEKNKLKETMNMKTKEDFPSHTSTYKERGWFYIISFFLVVKSSGYEVTLHLSGGEMLGMRDSLKGTNKDITLE